MGQVKATKDEIRFLMDSACKSLDVSRSELATMIGITYSALCGYITRESVQTRSLSKMKDMIENPDKYKFQPEQPKALDLKTIPLDDLLKEIESRGWIIDGLKSK